MKGMKKRYEKGDEGSGNNPANIDRKRSSGRSAGFGRIPDAFGQVRRAMQKRWQKWQKI